ncbi:molybdopterin synthase catalytic subunit [Hordeum vulgare]|nr:molybdopterin synthase catalytic subunit [Hordeum vulgare]
MAGDEAPTTEAACQDLVEILDEGSGRLDIGRYVDHVRDLSAGTIATFEGTTRDHLDGRRVVELRKEAYGSMAQRQLKAISARPALPTRCAGWPWRTASGRSPPARPACSWRPPDLDLDQRGDGWGWRL